MRHDAHAIHAALGADGWREVLLQAGIDESVLRDRHGPCPICGGKDRFRFDNKRGRGDWICNQCGAGDGFGLLMRVLSMSFSEVRAMVMDRGRLYDAPAVVPPPAREAATPATPSQRVFALLRESCAVEDCEPARRYLASRKLWPLPSGHGLRAHPSVAYWQTDENRQPQQVGRFPALIAAVRDMSGELVTAHATYLTAAGEKLANYEPRKLLSGLTAREGCAVQLMSHAAILGIAEGIETALSAARMHDMPVWAALNTSLLAKWEPPHTVDKVVIFADRDVAGLVATTSLMERLQERVRLEVRVPPKVKDWNDALRAAA